MKVHELIELLKEFPNGMDVYLATTKHETVPIADVRDEHTRAGTILLLSSPGVWVGKKPNQC